jgi:hypothetical protein
MSYFPRYLNPVVVGCVAILINPLGVAKSPAKSPLGRYLLVASEGLYVVEPDGRCSWSYNPAPQGKQVRGMEEDIIYDGWALPNGHFLYSTHQYLREIDQGKRTVWEYRVQAPVEVKSGVPLANGGVAVLNSQEQAVLELESGTGKVLRRIPVPAKGTDHTRYMLMRRTPEGNYLVALRAEQKFVEVSPAGTLLHSYAVPDLPVMAQRLADGSTMATGRFGMVKLDADWKSTWSFTRADAAPHFPLLIAWGVVELPGHRLVVVNDDWHVQKKDDNRIQLFGLDATNKVTWTLPATAFDGWKRSELEPRTGLIEHRSVIVRPL